MFLFIALIISIKRSEKKQDGYLVMFHNTVQGVKCTWGGGKVCNGDSVWSIGKDDIYDGWGLTVVQL